MLEQFTIKNFTSFKDETILDMTAIKAYKEHEYNLIENGIKEKLIKVAAIYGANASGKSNLHFAMNVFQTIIIESLNNVKGGEVPAISEYYYPFMFDKNKENTEFQIIEIIDDFEYKYGFEYNEERIVAEWMYRKNIYSNRSVTIFERDNDSIEFGASVRRKCDTYKEQIPSETLVLSFFNKLKLDTNIFTSLYQGILETLVVNTDLFENINRIDKILIEVIDGDKKGLLDFLIAIDTGIKDINYEKNDNEIIFFTTHIDNEGNSYPINLFNESEGTVKSIIIFIYAEIAISNNKSMFVDELNTKLHPLLLKLIIDLFYKKNSKAQLIYTTHDTTLLDKKFFRRDQIWFVQKDKAGCSKLIALSDFKVRADASFEKDYLAGVYGGIPLINDFELKEGK